MAPTLRRSRRSRKPTSYRVGDIVEIMRRNGVSNGRLIYRLTEGSASPNPLWLVTFDDKRVKDEEVYERSFGRLIRSTDEDDQPLNSRVNNNERRRKTEEEEEEEEEGEEEEVDVDNEDQHYEENVDGTSHNESSSHSHTSSSELDENAKQKRRKKKAKTRKGNRNNKKNGDCAKKSVSFAQDVVPAAASDPPSPSTESPTYGGTASSTKNGSLSAREQRSLRRQAKIDAERKVLPLGSKRKLSSATSRNGAGGGSCHTAKKAKTDPDEEVIKVKMLTGTLYLYRGVNGRRAEFIRRF